MIRRLLLIFAFSLILTRIVSAADQNQFLAGADISMLPTLEHAGAVYQSAGKPGDAIQILRDHGCNLFRVRLFVNPNPDYGPTDGAVQDLKYVEGLARRIKAAGGEFLLDIHYSDTWADPGKQYKPEAWKSLDFDGLERKVNEYTSSVLSELRAANELPDLVQVGNEITSGMIWPDGKVLDAPKDQEAAQWKKFSRLFNAGARAVRSFQTPDHPIRIMFHIHGGGRAGLPQWFFGKFNQNKTDYDCIGLSFYPAWGDSLDALKQNMAELIRTQDKDVFVAETSYPWHDASQLGGGGTMNWPCTPAGQKQFLHDLIAVLHGAPGGHGLGFAWWYPEARPTPGLRIWRDGAEGIFDRDGVPLPAMDLFGEGR